MKKSIFILIPLFLIFSCEDAKDDEETPSGNDEDTPEVVTFQGTWNFSSQMEYTDLACSIPDEEALSSLPGLTINGTFVVGESDVSTTLNYVLTGEFWCSVMGGTVSADGSSCSDGEESLPLSLIWTEETCSDIGGDEPGVWDNAAMTCSASESENSTYTLNGDTTMIYLNSARCYSDQDDDYNDLNEADCIAAGDTWETDSDTLQISFAGNTLTMTETFDGDSECDCPESAEEEDDCSEWDSLNNWDLNEADCAAAGGDWKTGEECFISVYTKN